MAGKPDPFDKIRHPKKRAFLAAMASTASVVRAAEIVGMDRTNHYVWFKNDPDYAAAFETARMQGVDVLEAEAVIPAAVREYSDTLLIFMLKGRNPAVFGDRQKQEHSAPGGGGITLVVRSVLQPPEEIET